MAEAEAEAEFGCFAYVECDVDCESFSRLYLEKEKEKEKARLRKLRRRRRKANMAVEDQRRAGCGDDGGAERRLKADMAVEDHREQGAGCGDDGWADLEPLFFDEAAAVAEHGRRMQKEQQRQQEEAHNRKLCIARQAALDRIREYDPKSKDGSTYFARLEYVDDIITFDHDEESPLGPMRDTEALIYAHGTVRGDSANMLASDGEKKLIASDSLCFSCTEACTAAPLGRMRDTEALIYAHAHGSVWGDSANMLVSKGEKKLIASDSANLRSIEISFLSSDGDGDNRPFVPEDSANVFSIKIVSSDVGFPIDVYGTVIARDNIDLKCVYLFRRDRDHCQLILSKDESLIVTGPKRGLALKYYMYFEFDLKIKCVGRQKDKQLSKGYLALNASNYRWEELEVESKTLDTKLSKVMITYAVVHTAIEATFAIEVLQGRFYGEIIACTTGIRDSIVLYDSKMVEAMTNSGKGVQLLRNVVAVNMREKLILSIVSRTGDGKTKSTTIRFTPGITGGEKKEITCGSFKMCVKVSWSIISRRLE